MDKVRKQKRQAQTKNEILQAAEEILITSQINDLTMRSLAKSLSISGANLYNYYKNKDEILIDLYKKTCNIFLNKLKTQPFDEQNPLQSFTDLCCFMCLFRIENSKIYREISLQKPFKETPEELTAIREYFKKRIRELRPTYLKTKKSDDSINNIILALAEGVASLVTSSFSEERLESGMKIMKEGMDTLLLGFQKD